MLLGDLTIICLTNSRKPGGRCVAGLDCKTGEWIRPVRRGGGAVTIGDISYISGHPAKVLDIIKIPVIEREPLYYQPENWVIDIKKYWEKKGKFSAEELENFCGKVEYIFCNSSDRLSVEQCQSNVDSSLTLVKLNKIMFEKKEKPHGSGTQIRAHFKYKKHWYNLVVTDVEWEQGFNKKENGCHEYEGVFYLVISLGELLETTNSHFKLVASVIIMS